MAGHLGAGRRTHTGALVQSLSGVVPKGEHILPPRRSKIMRMAGTAHCNAQYARGDMHMPPALTGCSREVPGLVRQVIRSRASYGGDPGPRAMGRSAASSWGRSA